MISLITAWEQWDAKPSDRDRAVAMNDACKDAAAFVGMTTNDFRQVLAAVRRSGRSREQTLAFLDHLRGVK